MPDPIKLLTAEERHRLMQTHIETNRYASPDGTALDPTSSPPWTTPPTGTASNGLPKPTAQARRRQVQVGQRRYIWAVVPRAAKRWDHNRGTSKSMWAKRRPARPSIKRAPSSRGRQHKR